MGNISTLAINAATFAKLPSDPQKSFAPVTMVAILPLLIAVHPSVPAKTMKELAALAKAKPGELAYGTASRASSCRTAHPSRSSTSCTRCW